MKDFLDAGAVLVSHSNYPVSPSFSAPWTMCFGTIGYLPSKGKEMCRHEEKRMGSLEIGKLANITVFDKDFLKDDLAEVENAKCLATFDDGVQVYKA